MASTRRASLKVMLVCALLILSIGQLVDLAAAADGEDDVTTKSPANANDSLKEKLCECSTKCIFKPDDRICFQNCMVGRDSSCYSCKEGKPCDDKGKGKGKEQEKEHGAEGED